MQTSIISSDEKFQFHMLQRQKKMNVFCEEKLDSINAIMGLASLIFNTLTFLTENKLLIAGVSVVSAYAFYVTSTFKQKMEYISKNFCTFTKSDNLKAELDLDLFKLAFEDTAIPNLFIHIVFAKVAKF